MLLLYQKAKKRRRQQKPPAPFYRRAFSINYSEVYGSKAMIRAFLIARVNWR